MPTTLPLRASQRSQWTSQLRRSALAAYVLSLVALSSLIVINGPQMRAAAEAQEAQAIEAENKAFCSRFGIGPETGRYAQCAAELAEIRARHLQRNANDFIF